MNMTAKKIYHHAIAAKHIVLVPHQHPDGDTLGSVTAFMEWLRQIEKTHTAFCSTPISPKLHYLPHVESVTHDPIIWKNAEVDLVIVFDSGDLRYAGVADYVHSMPQKPTIINFDHHNTNEFFGHENMVDTKESSTTAVLYHFFLHNMIPINAPMATSLLTGLMTDTDHFTNAATSKSSLAIGSKLMQKGANAELIKQWILKDKTVKGLRLWGTTLSRLTYNPELDLVYTYVTQDDLQKHRVSDTEVEGIANFLNNLREGKAAMILKELPDGRIKGSFRTTRDDMDVSHFAKQFGGGGHKKAAGFSVDGPMEQAISQVIEQLIGLKKSY